MAKKGFRPNRRGMREFLKSEAALKALEQPAEDLKGAFNNAGTSARFEVIDAEGRRAREGLHVRTESKNASYKEAAAGRMQKILQKRLK